MPSAEGPFRFDFGGPSERATSPAAATTASEQDNQWQNSVELRPPVQVVLFCCVLFPAPALSDMQSMQLSPSLELDKVTLNDALYLLKVS